ncbi:ABC transporter substrate-binding protein [Rubrivivax sp. RP6-9]|uniref:ABC transporter substrate-binding protein n=1 Tax=Rubrivivax sp. RP6-9 TaxID=3415750 RepID=UPI003CC621CB
MCSTDVPDAAVPASPTAVRRRRLLHWATAAGIGAAALAPRALRAAQPVLLGFDGEFGVAGSSSAQAIQAGIEIALDEINTAGGVLGGRPLTLVTRDNRAMPPRTARHLREFAEMPDLVGVFCGRFSPTVLESLPLVHTLRLPLFDPWASADGIIEHAHRPSYTFRLAVPDRWALPLMSTHAARRGQRTLGMLAVNTAWGRSSDRALAAHLAARMPTQRMVATRWFNYTDGPEVIAARYGELVQAGAEAVLFIGNYREGAELLLSVAAMAQAMRRPVLAHTGVTGGDLHAAARGALATVDLGVVQAFGFGNDRRPRAAAVRAAALQRLGGNGRTVPSVGGLAQAYDLTHIVARSIDLAGSTSRTGLRDALERAPAYNGLIRDYPAPFTPTRHEALAESDLYIARFDADGVLVRAT